MDGKSHVPVIRSTGPPSKFWANLEIGTLFISKFKLSLRFKLIAHEAKITGHVL